MTVANETFLERMAVVEVKLDRVKIAIDSLLSELLRAHSDLLEIRLSLQRLKDDTTTEQPPKWDKGST